VTFDGEQVKDSKCHGYVPTEGLEQLPVEVVEEAANGLELRLDVPDRGRVHTLESTPSVQSLMRLLSAAADPPQSAEMAEERHADMFHAAVAALSVERSARGTRWRSKIESRDVVHVCIEYADAIERGFAQNKMILDAPVAFKKAGGNGDWRPENFSKTYRGEITLRKALAISENIPAVRLIEMLGPQSVVRFARRLGIQSNLKPYLSLALGTSEVTLLELTAAYAVFPRGGKWIEPFGIWQVIDRRNRVIWHARPRKHLAMSREAAAIVTDMLTAVIREGTGRKARSLSGPLAGKTGTTNNYHDALFIGFSPDVVAGAWVGRDAGGTLGPLETGARAALPIWKKFMAAALAKRTNLYFDIPDNVIKVPIDPDTGQRAADGARNAVSVLFKKGTEPK
jgi:penicillin-binding protein 1A